MEQTGNKSQRISRTANDMWFHARVQKEHDLDRRGRWFSEMRVGDMKVRLVRIDRQQHRSRGAPGLRLPPFPLLSAAISRAWAFVPGMDGTVPKSVRDPLVPVASILTVLRKRARAQCSLVLVWSGLVWPGLARTIYRSPRKYAECRRLPCGNHAERVPNARGRLRNFL